jgi:hypothetical protein
MSEMHRPTLSYPPDPQTLADARAWKRTVASGFASPRMRQRPRPEEEAAWLTRVGTPARLIGPIGS